MYDHKDIEKKWQHFWKENKTFKSSPKKGKKKYYILDMFPYPSGSGLHVGHLVGYTGSDIIARYKVMKGFSVMHPMGWDSFGLPAEQYAIKTNVHPEVSTKKNIANYKRQLSMVGFSYDWDRQITTSDKNYYKWTQWLFTKFYEKDLVYEASISVNFCPALNSVLANEEVKDGLSKEGHFPVEKRYLRQWVMKITHYADRLLEDLDLIDWPENIKKMQRNWIGKSSGTDIYFKHCDSGEVIETFTTRADTIFGCSYVVVAPEYQGI